MRHFQGLERHRLRKHPAGPDGTAPIEALFGVLTPSATDAPSGTSFQRRQAKRSTFLAVTVDTLCFRGSAGAPPALVLSAFSWPSMLKNVDLLNSPYRPPPLR